MKKTIVNLFIIFSLFILPHSNIYAEKEISIENPKVSIIIPVYKVEKFISQCLDSLINQTLKEIEIICINDGSPDRSIDILNCYSQHDKRIKVINQKNQGSATARNRGIEESKGEYIKFVDADDILDIHACEICYRKAKEVNADILVHSSYGFNNNSK